MRAHSCHWSISCYAHNTDCAYSSFAIVFSASFGAIGIDLATGGTLQQVKLEVTVDWQHASRCGKRETRRSEKVAHIIGLQMRPLQERVWFTACHGHSSQTQLVVWNTVCRSQEPQVHVIHWTRRSSCWDSPSTWYPRCVGPTSNCLLRTCRLYIVYNM